MSGFGDISKLGKLASNIRKLASVPSQASKDAAVGIANLIENQFDTGTDPYGNAWAPLKKGGASHLTENHPLRDSIEVKPMSGGGVSVTIGEEYGYYHQTGTSRMPARPILPVRTMPEAWRTAISDACDAAFERTAASMGDL